MSRFVVQLAPAPRESFLNLDVISEQLAQLALCQ